MKGQTKIKRCEVDFESLQYNLIMYYHPIFTTEEILHRIKKNEELLTDAPINEDDQFAALFLSNSNVSTFYLILTKDVDLTVIHHESIHITTRAFELIGSQHNDGTDELYAYHSQLVFKTILETMVNKFKVTIQSLYPLT